MGAHRDIESHTPRRRQRAKALCIGAWLTVLALLAPAGQPRSAYGQAEPETCEAEVHAGIRHCVKGAVQILRIDPRNPRVRFETVLPLGYDRDGNFGECRDVNTPANSAGPGCERDGQYPAELVGRMAERFPDAVAAFNTDLFSFPEYEHGPLGLTVKNGERLDGLYGDHDENEVTRASLTISRDGKVRIGVVDRHRLPDPSAPWTWRPDPAAYFNTVGGHPLLVADGVPVDVTQQCQLEGGGCPAPYTRRARTAVGKTAGGQLVVMVIPETDGVTLQQLADLMAGLGAVEAINLDGGGSSQLWYDGRYLVFSPRPVVEALVVRVAASPVNDPFGDAFPVSEIAYALPLTVRHVTETSATLDFELDIPTEGSLFYQPVEASGSEPGQVPLAPRETRRQITLEGLEPGSAYQAIVALRARDGAYQQPSFLGQVWGPVRFRTVSDEEPLWIGVIGDAGFGDAATAALVEEMAAYDLDFVLHTGDVVYATEGSVTPPEDYARKFYAPFAPLLHQMPVYTVIGNHDYDAAMRWQGAPFYDHAFPGVSDPRFTPPERERRSQFYAFAYRNIQFLMLDSQVFFGVEGRAEQDVWLHERLSDTRFALTIPVFHVPPYSSSAVHRRDGIPVRRTWSPWFEAAGVPIVFSGHSHHYERLVAGGVTYIVSGGGSAVLYDAGERLSESQAFARRTHFVLVEIGSGQVQLSAIALGGEVLDRVAIPLE